MFRRDPCFQDPRSARMHHPCQLLKPKDSKVHTENAGKMQDRWHRWFDPWRNFCATQTKGIKRLHWEPQVQNLFQHVITVIPGREGDENRRSQEMMGYERRWKGSNIEERLGVRMNQTGTKQNQGQDLSSWLLRSSHRIAVVRLIWFCYASLRHWSEKAWGCLEWQDAAHILLLAHFVCFFHKTITVWSCYGIFADCKCPDQSSQNHVLNILHFQPSGFLLRSSSHPSSSSKSHRSESQWDLWRHAVPWHILNWTPMSSGGKLQGLSHFKSLTIRF